MSATLRGPSGLTYLDETVLTIGRSRQNRLVFTHNQVSSKHVEIQPLGMGRYQVVDVGSSNGTLVNGMRLSKGTPYALSDGDVLLLGGSGGVELAFALSAAPVVSPAPVLQPQVYAPVIPQQAYAEQQVPVALVPIPPPPMYPYGRPEPPAGAPPLPAPMPMAISNVARYKRPPKIFLVAGSLLLVVLVVVGVVLGTKLIGGTASPQKTGPVAVGTVTPGSPVVQTAKVTVQGKETTVLTTTKGLTLYYFTPDTATTTACTGDCIAKWPPLLFDGAGALTAASDLPGTLSIQTSDNGAQVAYNGHPLYTFSGDSAPGQTNGEGKNGKWFVVTPDLAVNGDTSLVVETKEVTIEGASATVLTTTEGLTLYYFTADTATTSACTGACATTWVPLLFSGDGTPEASPELPGVLSVQDTDNGPQVEYNGHLLYTFSGDTAPGQTNGEGKNGKWFIVTPDLEVLN